MGTLATNELRNVMVIKSKVHKPDNLKSHNPLKLSFISRDSTFVCCESSLEPNSADILAILADVPDIIETNLED